MNSLNLRIYASFVMLMVEIKATVTDRIYLKMVVSKVV